MAKRQRLAVAVSGGGRTLANFLACTAQTSAGSPDATSATARYEVAAVITSNPDCGAVTIAREAGLPLFIGTFSAETLPDVGPRLYAWLREQGIDWVALGGFMKLFPLHPDWHGRIINIHPALLPAFGGHGMYGDRVHRAVLAAGATQSGATVHFVNERYDEGAIIAQITVPLRAHDTPETLAKRVFAAECKLYPFVVNGLIEGRLPRADGRIEILTETLAHER